MTPYQMLVADRDRIRSRVAAVKPDNVVELEMYRADLRRAEKALSDWKEAPELRVLRGIVRGEAACPSS